MLRVKIIMDTVDAAKEIEAITKNIRETAIKNTGEFTDTISITDSSGFKVNASSFVGLLYAMEFNELWLESEGDYYTQYEKFIAGAPLNPPPVY